MKKWDAVGEKERKRKSTHFVNLIQVDDFEGSIVMNLSWAVRKPMEIKIDDKIALR